MESSCVWDRYAPQMAWVEDLLRDVAFNQGLDFDTTFEAIPGTMTDETACHNSTTCIEAFLADNTTVAEYILARPNQTQNVVSFQSAYLWPELRDIVPNATSYTLFYNVTIDKCRWSRGKPALPEWRNGRRCGRGVQTLSSAMITPWS